MKIAVVGTGYVGLVSAACFAELGHTVTGIDIDAAKIEKLKSGKSTIYEPGLEELIQKGLSAKLLSFTIDLKSALPDSAIVFCAVATPPGEGSKADLRAVFTVADAVATHADHDLLFVTKSTVPVGTGKKCEERINAILAARFSKDAPPSPNLQSPISIPVISNPEFLREGLAVSDTLMPERIVVGVNGMMKKMQRMQKKSSSESSASSVSSASFIDARKMMEELYRPITRVGKPLLFMSRESAEIVKYASNAFLATKISFINMLSELCEKTGANIRDVAAGMGHDSRIGPRFLHAGIGYGGSCFPKDVKALLALAREEGLDFGIVEATDRINTHQRKRFFDQILKALPAKATVGIWGLSFKPKTDDMRDAPSLDIVRALLNAGHTIRAYDPAAMENARMLFGSALLPGDSLRYFELHSPIGAARGSDAVVLLTEWDVFRGIDLRELKSVMKGRDLFDGRNVYEPKEIAEAGLTYHGIGIG